MQAQEDEDDQDDNDSDEDEEDEVEDDMGASDAEILDIVDDVDAQDEQTDGKIIILDNVSRQLLSFFLSLAHHKKHSYCAHSCHNKLPSSRSYFSIVKFRRWIWINVGNVMQVKR